MAGVVAGQVEQRVSGGHAERAGTGPGLDDLVAGLDVTLGEHAHVEAGPVVADQQRGQVRLAEAQPDPVAGDPGLGDLELCLADPVAVPDAHLVVGQAVDGQVLPELAVAEVVAPEVLLPVLVGLDLVDQHGALLAAMPVQVALAVPVDVEPADHLRPRYGVFPDAGVDGLAPPGDVARQADVHRQQLGQPVASFRGGRRKCGGSGAGHDA